MIEVIPMPATTVGASPTYIYDISIEIIKNKTAIAYSTIATFTPSDSVCSW